MICPHCGEQVGPSSDRAKDLRKRGRSYRQISAEMGISVGLAHALVNDSRRPGKQKSRIADEARNRLTSVLHS